MPQQSDDALIGPSDGIVVDSFDVNLGGLFRVVPHSTADHFHGDVQIVGNAGPGVAGNIHCEGMAEANALGNGFQVAVEEILAIAKLISVVRIVGRDDGKQIILGHTGIFFDNLL